MCIRSRLPTCMKAVYRAVLLAAAVSPGCAVYESALLGSGSAGFAALAGDGPGAGTSGVGSAAGEEISGASNSAGVGNPTVGSAGSTSGGAGGASPGGPAGAAGKLAEAGSGGSPNTGGNGSAGMGMAGSATGGASGSAGVAGAPAAIGPCNRVNWKATASKSSLSMNPPSLYNPPAQAIDGTTSTRWSSGAKQVGGEWFLVDLGSKAAHLTQVVLDTAKDSADLPVSYTLELSTDGTNFTSVATGAGAVITTITFADTPAQYLRITQTGAGVTWWTIHEFSITCQ